MQTRILTHIHAYILPHRAFAQLANYWDDQLQIQQQAANQLRRNVAEGIRDFHLTDQVRNY